MAGRPQKCLRVWSYRETEDALPFVALLVKTLKKAEFNLFSPPGKVAGSIPKQKQADST
jgi:hypothetical protein